ncbi:checkpoint protein HUS1-like [Liolophura sinensis]|uniref:checkpoint protein HUS1-like n=1 Tax=Liolophura sinensis TaxID=3198878 RepID=UPI003158977A
MRFRGKLVDIGCIQHFSRVTSTVSKLAKNCVLRLTRDKLYFILSEKAVSGEVQIWCELTQSHFFDEYAMEGLSREDANEIYLDLIPENLVKALRSSQSAKWVKLKLTKKQTPCLSVEVSLPSLTGHDRLVVHDIPVNVIPKRLWDEFEEPELPKFDVNICMPHWKLLRNIVDKMKNLSNFVVISANGSGELRLMVETDMASVSTHFRDLTNATWNKDDDGMDTRADSPALDPQQFVEARVDIRKFAQFLAGQQVNPYKIICNIVHNTTLHFFMLHEDVSLQYFMPVVQS